MTLSLRLKAIVTHIGLAIFGVVLGVIISYWAVRRIGSFRSEATFVAANDAYNSGKYEEAIFLLGQAAAEDREFYEPWNLLGKIYSREGKQHAALGFYKKALQVFDENGDPLAPMSERSRTRARILTRIDSLQKQENEGDTQ